MIVVDTSALIAVLLGEKQAQHCLAVLAAESKILISAGTVAEALIVAGRRNIAPEMKRLIEDVGFEVVDVTSASAQRIALAYERWGKGVNSAGLNFGDCFAYELAACNCCPLLFIGEDFSKTDIRSAL